MQFISLITFLGEGIFLARKRAFSLYDMEQFLREAGAERVNEKAVVSLGQELENAARDMINEAEMYANYAGRKTLIKYSDVRLVGRKRIGVRGRVAIHVRKRAVVVRQAKAAQTTA